MNNLKEHIIHWISPSFVVGICMYIYFFDTLGMSHLIAPEYNREFGLIENIQLLIILAIIFVSFKKLTKAKTKSIKLVFALILVGSILIFLEEIDYGLHYYDYFIGKSNEQISIEFSHKNSIRNIHNQGNLLHYIKLLAYISLGLIVVIPIVLKRLNYRNKYLNYIVPQHYFIYTIMSMTFINRAALYIDEFLKNNDINSLNSNVSEFEEVFIYYIVFLYILEKSSLLLTFDRFEIMKKNTVTNKD